ncbi:MAG: hypothetical protein IKD77_01535 [Bacilli bacterium]|nr:hypothetical protein [Bacilli bacterium]
MIISENYSTKDLKNALTEMIFIKAQGIEIQKKFEFVIPDYVLDEIVLARNKLNKANLQLMINMAVLNNRLTNEQAKELKNIFIMKINNSL